MLTIGYIGLGLMGKSIARNILKAGFPLVCNFSQFLRLISQSVRLYFTEFETGISKFLRLVHHGGIFRRF